jgi:hypothetical protein
LEKGKRSRRPASAVERAGMADSLDEGTESDDADIEETSEDEAEDGASGVVEQAEQRVQPVQAAPVVVPAPEVQVGHCAKWVGRLLRMFRRRGPRHRAAEEDAHPVVHANPLTV